MKICVYAICKNEEKHIARWVSSMKEADKIFVLDTGSSDNSVFLLKSMGVTVFQKKYSYFRFDVARNDLLDSISESFDLYVCTDLDEVFINGWRSILESNYDSSFNRVKYLYNWTFDDNGNPGTTYYLNKIHTKDFFWKYPVHEVLVCKGVERLQLINELVLNHYPDRNKSRSSYLPLLQLSVSENPMDSRCIHYLAREYMYYKKYHLAIKYFHRYLYLPLDLWKDEKAITMRFMAKCYYSLGYLEEAHFWYLQAISEAPYMRENYVEYAFALYNEGLFEDAIKFLDEAFLIRNKSLSYINEEFAWGYYIYELYAFCLLNINKKDIAKAFILKAISLNNNINNLLVFFD